ncbi:hypothetical protein F66182_3105 [Fusarium sp. NRRL 66182]|nr:hypothetical protein F66182_3105 [Fusarium sp. NRRL 66182]
MASRWFFLLLLITPSLAADDAENNFYFYPKGAIPCLEKASDDASCTGATNKELNYCLCGLGSYKNDFILGSARCIGEEAPKDVDETYETMKKACEDSGTPMKVTKEEFDEASHEGQVTTTTLDATTSTTTSTATGASATTATTTTTSGEVTATDAPSTSETSTPEDAGLSTAGTAGVAVGAAVGGAAIVGLFVWFFLQRRKKKTEESHPMLPNYEDRSPLTSSAEAKHGWPSPHPSSVWPSPHPSQAWPSPHPSQGWGTPDPQAGYYVPQKHGNMPAELSPEGIAVPTPVFEMDGTGVAVVEMPGSTPVDGPGEARPRSQPGGQPGEVKRT